MSTSTQHFGLVLPTTSDKWNPLLYENPAIEQIDTQMFVNQNHAIQTATHVRSGGINQIVRDVQTSMFFTFVATDDYFLGDTFTLDGEVVPARLADGSTLVANAFRINSNVLCGYENGILTIYSNSAVVDTSAIDERLDNIETEIGNTDYSDYGNTLSQAIDNVGVKADTAVTGVASLNQRMGGTDLKFDENGKLQYKDLNGEWVNFKSGEGATLLWTNPSPTVAFSPQTVALDLSEYDYVLFEVQNSTTTTNSTLVMLNKTDINNFIICGTIAGGYNGGRMVASISDNGVTFGTGAKIGVGNDNSAGIPTRIWGCKAVGDVPIKWGNDFYFDAMKLAQVSTATSAITLPAGRYMVFAYGLLIFNGFISGSAQNLNFSDSTGYTVNRRESLQGDYIYRYEVSLNKEMTLSVSNTSPSAYISLAQIMAIKID